MNITVPIYVEGMKPRDGSGVVYHARPLFHAQPAVRGEKLDRLLARLAQDLGKVLTELGRAPRHDDLTAFTFYPRLAQQRLDLTLLLRRRTARCRFLFVTFRHFGRQLAFTPSLPEVWFDVQRGEKLKDRATDVLTRHFRALERDEQEIDPEGQALTGSAEVTPLEIAIHPPVLPPKEKDLRFLFLGDAAPLDGAEELHRVGRCLDWLFPDELDRVVLRDSELAELTRLLSADERRPVLLLGPRQVGKSALVHEYVYRQVSQRASPYHDRRNVWLLAPARLISGMSYVGQWENRLLAIIKEARRREHILYVDDLLGLFLAGQSSQSAVSVADVLKPYLERRQVRLLGEITPEAFRVLRERDRGLADLFHVLPLSEPGEADNLRIQIEVQRQLENAHRCRFDVDVLPAVLDLQRRYGRGLAFPGKAATFLRQLAVKQRNNAVTREAALTEFHARSGLAVTFLDRQARLDRQEVIAAISTHIIGQQEAVEAAADVISIAKARINDPGRPLAAFLFLGPTGVGKTQCAKAFATYLFGDADRLLRFDLNEYADPGSASRLVGTFSQPEGLLTSAIRRQPFAVVLFDEVEKAHPEVFDLLLQVLGEGRLSDALGRTVDFGNALIVLTSNLGVREAESRFGYRPEETSGATTFVQAAERFFRPEFFNRLDRVIPFRRLTRDHVRAIAHKLIQDVFRREGLVQRKCLLCVEPAAMERIVDQGYDPVLGARALKRAIERHLTQPIALQLAALPPGDFSTVRVYPGPDQLAVHVQALEQVGEVMAPRIDLSDPDALLDRLRAMLRRVDGDMAALRPPGPITLGQVPPEHYRYFTLREQADLVRSALRKLGEQLEATRTSQRSYPSYRKPDSVRGYRVMRNVGDAPDRPFLRALAAALDLNEYLREVFDSAQAIGSGPQAPALVDLLRQAALLDTIAESLKTRRPERTVLWLRGLAADCHDVGKAPGYLCVCYRAALKRLRLDVQELQSTGEGKCLLVQGPHTLAIAEREAGTHLFVGPDADVEPCQVHVVPLRDGEDPHQAINDRIRQRQAWLEDLTRGHAQAADEPLAFGPVLRIYDRRNGIVDLRTGLTAPFGDVAARMLAALPLPAEIESDESASL